MTYLVTFKTEIINAEKAARRKEAQEFFNSHPRLSFEPRSVSEHYDHQTYQKLKDLAAEGEYSTIGDAVGTYVQHIVHGETAFVVLFYNDNFIEVHSGQIISVHTIPESPSWPTSTSSTDKEPSINLEPSSADTTTDTAAKLLPPSESGQEE